MPARSRRSNILFAILGLAVIPVVAGGGWLAWTAVLVWGVLVGLLWTRRSEDRAAVLATATVAAETAELRAELQRHFIALVSDELRTPLTTIRGYLQLLLDGVPAPAHPDNLGVLRDIDTAAAHLQELVDSVLLFDDLDSGHARVTIDRVSVDDLTFALRLLMAPVAKARGLSFSIDTTYAPNVVTTDVVKLRLVLVSLITNALKFTNEGTVTLRVHEDPATASVLFVVTDPGIGISLADQAHIFEPLTQAKHSLARPVGGLGMGLAVAQRAMGLLGGRITVTSEVGRGSRFMLSIPK